MSTATTVTAAAFFIGTAVLIAALIWTIHNEERNR